MSESNLIKYVQTTCPYCGVGCTLNLVVKDGKCVGVEAYKRSPVNDGKLCPKGVTCWEHVRSPDRLTAPLIKKNGKFEEASWDEALDLVAAKLNDIRARGLIDEVGLPRVAATFGHGGTPASYMGSFPAYLSAWGMIDYSFGSGQGVKCVHSEHLYGEYWHRAFTVSADTPNANSIVSFGANVEITGGPCAAARHASARVRGAQRVQIEPHLSITAGASAEWVPIKPKTDPAFMFAMIHILVHENPRERLDLVFLRDTTSSPYLVGPHGYFMRDPDSLKPLIWDSSRNAAVPHDTPGIEPMLEGRVVVAHAIEIGVDEERWRHTDCSAETSFFMLVSHMHKYSPEWAAAICDVPASTIRRIANEFLDQACVGQTVEVDGEFGVGVNYVMVCQHFELHAIKCVRGIGNQLAQKDFAVVVCTNAGGPVAEKTTDTAAASLIREYLSQD